MLDLGLNDEVLIGAVGVVVLLQLVLLVVLCGGKEKDEQPEDMVAVYEAFERDLQMKILLLGAGESGKSTLVKQMKLLRRRQPDKTEIQLYSFSIHKNILDCALALVNARRNFRIDESDKEILEAEERLLDYDFVETNLRERLTAEIAKDIAVIWKAKSIQRTYERRTQFYILDAAPYYFENLERLTEADFIPSEEDMVMTRVRTPGLVETQFEEGPIKYNVVDVAGQVGERRKWIHCFSDVKAVIFVCSLPGYTQVMFEDPGKNKMDDSLTLFETVAQNPLFEGLPIFLLLNKKDIFTELLETRHLSDVYPEYEGGADYVAALDFIKTLHEEKMPPGATLKTSFITARFKKDVKYAWEEIKEAISEHYMATWNKALKGLGREQIRE